MEFLETLGYDYEEKYGFHDDSTPVLSTKPGLSEQIVREISRIKNEPRWLLDFRLRALKVFMSKPMPSWGGDLSKIDFGSITYYIKPSERSERTWEEVPENIRNTFDRLGIPEAEKKFLGGVGAQYESEIVYHKIREDLEKQGVIFVDPNTAFREHGDIFRKFFGTVVPIEDNKFAALNSAVFSGGSFIYVPENTRVELPLQAYFRINSKNMGQFERTLIIADKGSSVNYVEGCLPFDEEILTGSRLVSIADIKKDDSVLNDNGEETSVEKTTIRQYEGDLIDITPVSTGNRFFLTPEHPVLAIKRENVVFGNRENRKFGDINPKKLTAAKPDFIPAGELGEGDLIIYPVNKTIVDKREITDDMLAFLGYYLAEGHQEKINGCDAVVLTFNERERETIDHVKETCKNITGKIPSEFHSKSKHAITLTVYSKRLSELCIEHCGKGAENKRLSKAIMGIPPTRQKIIMDSYYKGDGSISYGNPTRVRALTVSKQLAFQLQELLARQGIYACINVREPYSEKMKNGKVIHHKRKYTIFYSINRRSINVKLIDDRFAVPIRRISKKPYAGFVYNFHVSGEPNTYLVKGFAVHNCTAPIYSSDSLHSAVVELIALEDAKIRYTTIQNWSTNVYNLVTKRAHAHKNAVVQWVDANIGCLTGNTKIFLNNDVKEIKNIEPGDIVFALDENMKLARRQVVAKKYSGVQKVFRLISENHRKICATLNHPFLTLSKEGKILNIKWKRLDEIKKNDLVAVSGDIPDFGKPFKIKYANKRRTRTHIKFPEASTEDLMWLLGFYIGDGYADKARIYFAVPENDKSHSKLLGLIEKLFGLKKFERRGVVVRYNSADFVSFIKNIGFAGSARTKSIPKWVFTLPKAQKIAFINGYIDADGHAKKGHKNISITSVNRQLLEDVKLLSLTSGLDSRKILKCIRREKKPLGKEEKEYSHYFLYFGENNPVNHIQFTRISSIECIGEEDTYDIEVDGAHNFVADGFIVHNSKLTMKYPSVYLVGSGAKADIISVAFAGRNQYQDAGGKVLHQAPDTKSTIISKSISRNGGRASYRGLVHVRKDTENCQSSVRCDALLLDEESRSDTYPTIDINDKTATMVHEATVGKVGEEQIFYLTSRGLKESEAIALIILGFIEEFTKELPMEYAIEMNRLIQMEMEGSVG